MKSDVERMLHLVIVCDTSARTNDEGALHEALCVLK